MANNSDVEAIRIVVLEYLEGMIYGQDERLRGSMHPQCMQAGHYDGQYEFITRDAFIDAMAPLEKQPPGSEIRFDVPILDITGDLAVAKVVTYSFGTKWTDYLTFVRHNGAWQIVMKAFYDHANDGG